MGIVLQIVAYVILLTGQYLCIDILKEISFVVLIGAFIASFFGHKTILILILPLFFVFSGQVLSFH
jgi:hypothetical protein